MLTPPTSLRAIPPERRPPPGEAEASADPAGTPAEAGSAGAGSSSKSTRSVLSRSSQVGDHEAAGLRRRASAPPRCACRRGPPRWPGRSCRGRPGAGPRRSWSNSARPRPRPPSPAATSSASLRRARSGSGTSERRWPPSPPSSSSRTCWSAIAAPTSRTRAVVALLHRHLARPAFSQSPASRALTHEVGVRRRSSGALATRRRRPATPRPPDSVPTPPDPGRTAPSPGTASPGASSSVVPWSSVISDACGTAAGATAACETAAGPPITTATTAAPTRRAKPASAVEDGQHPLVTSDRWLSVDGKGSAAGRVTGRNGRSAGH